MEENTDSNIPDFTDSELDEYLIFSSHTGGHRIDNEANKQRRQSNIFGFRSGF